mmetsp:Transcript_34881/g.84279  ORF Transcript_34881/g.84279 Transcript_34881/m.84279 type:complete len:210 (-) Transcript_34881:262-891(-)
MVPSSRARSASRRASVRSSCNFLFSSSAASFSSRSSIASCALLDTSAVSLDISETSASLMAAVCASPSRRASSDALFMSSMLAISDVAFSNWTLCVSIMDRTSSFSASRSTTRSPRLETSSIASLYCRVSRLMLSSANALILDNLAYSSWMVRTRTESSSAEAFSSMGLVFFLAAGTPPLEPPVLAHKFMLPRDYVSFVCVAPANLDED